MAMAIGSAYLSGVDAPEVTPMVMGPFFRKFFSTTTSPAMVRCSMELSGKMRSARSMWYDSTPAHREQRGR